MKKIKVIKYFRNWWLIRHFGYGLCLGFRHPSLTRPYCFIRRWYLKIKGLI